MSDMSCDGKCTLDYCKHAMRLADHNGYERANAELQSLRSKVAALESCIESWKKEEVLWNETTTRLESQLSTAQAENRTMREALESIEAGRPGPPLNSAYTSELALATWTASQAQATARAALAEIEKGKRDADKR